MPEARRYAKITRGAAIACVLGALAWSAAGAPSPTHAASAPPLAGSAALRPVFGALLGNPPVLRLDATADPGAQDYARIDLYAEHAVVQGLRIDQLWIRLLGAALDQAALQHGTLKVLNVRESAVYGRVALQSVQDLLNHESTVKNATLTANGDTTTVDGTIVYNGLPTHVRMQGLFQVYGAPEIFFHVQQLIVDSIPMPQPFVDQVERQINPVVDFRRWPVPFPIRTFHQTGSAFILSSQADYTQPCSICGGTPVQLKP